MDTFRGARIVAKVNVQKVFVKSGISKLREFSSRHCLSFSPSLYLFQVALVFVLVPVVWNCHGQMVQVTFFVDSFLVGKQSWNDVIRVLKRKTCFRAICAMHEVPNFG